MDEHAGAGKKPTPVSPQNGDLKRHHTILTDILLITRLVTSKHF